MNKIVFLIFTILLYLVNSEDKIRCENQEKEALNISDCMDREIDEELNEDYCCFIKYRTKLNKIIKGCAPISMEEIESLEETIEYFFWLFFFLCYI